MKKDFSIRRFWESLHINSLPPAKKALSLTVGFYASLFPLLGATTLLNLLGSLLFKVNVVITQALNLVLMPLQLLLMYPFFFVGRILFFPENEAILSLSFKQIVETDTRETLFLLLETLAGGITVWALASAITGFFFYQILLRTSFVKLESQTVQVRT